MTGPIPVVAGLHRVSSESGTAAMVLVEQLPFLELVFMNNRCTNFCTCLIEFHRKKARGNGQQSNERLLVVAREVAAMKKTTGSAFIPTLTFLVSLTTYIDTDRIRCYDSKLISI